MKDTIVSPEEKQLSTEKINISQPTPEPTTNTSIQEVKTNDEKPSTTPVTVTTTKPEMKTQFDESIIRVHNNPSTIETSIIVSAERHSTPEVTSSNKIQIIQEIQSLTQLNNLRFSEILSSHARSLEMNRKAIQIPQPRSKECDAFRIIRCSGNSCSKDTLSYIDQNGHGLMDDDDNDEDNICSKQSALWVR